MLSVEPGTILKSHVFLKYTILTVLCCTPVGTGHFAGSGGDNAAPFNLQLTPRRTGMMGIPDVYSADITVGHVGPLSVLVDTGSSSLVVKGDFGIDSGARTKPLSRNSFLAASSDGEATIKYEGALVTGNIRRNEVCLHSIKQNHEVDETAEAAQLSPETHAQAVHEKFQELTQDETEQGGQSQGNLDACTSNFPIFEVESQDAGFSKLGLDGVLGLGPIPGKAKLGLDGLDETMLDGLASSKLQLPRVFGLFTSPRNMFGPSILTLGGFDATKISPSSDLRYWPLAQPSTGRWEIALQDILLVSPNGSAPDSLGPCGTGAGKSGDCRALVDSGTALLEAAPELTYALNQRLWDSTGQCLQQSQMPDLHLKFPGDAVFKLGPEDYMQNVQACQAGVDAMPPQAASASGSKSTGVAALILGQPFLRKYYAVFDQEGGRIGLAPSVATGSQTQNEMRREDQKEHNKLEQEQTLAEFIRSP